MTSAAEPAGDSAPVILVTDGWLVNAGDVASYLATSAALKRELPNARVPFACHHRELVGHHWPELDLVPPLDPLASVRWPWTTEADLAERDVVERLVERADLAVVPGGGNLIESYQPEGRIRTYEELLARGKRLAFFAQSIGSFADRELANRLRAVLEAAELILVRDEPSREVVRGLLGDVSNLHLTADEAFLFEAPQRVPRPRTLLIVASAHPWFRGTGESELQESHLAALARSVVRMLESEVVRRVTLASTAQGFGPTGQALEDDALAAAQVYEAVPPNLRNRVELRTEYLPPAAFTELASAHAATVSMRMHGAILAAVAGTPALLANTSDKARDLATRSGGRLAAVTLAEELERLDELVEPMLTDRTEVLVTQDRVVEEMRALAESNATLVADLLR